MGWRKIWKEELILPWLYVDFAVVREEASVERDGSVVYWFGDTGQEQV